MRHTASCQNFGLANLYIDPGRLQLTAWRSDKGASAASKGLGGVGAVETSRDHEWRAEVTLVIVRSQFWFQVWR